MRFVFVGNRKFVLQEMIKQKCEFAAVFVVEGTHLQNDIDALDVPYDFVSSKDDLLQKLDTVDYDVLVSNGCPYILPVSDMKEATYVNIHPSALPDLKGIDPVIGAILHERDGGATAHIMDDIIDGGSVIAQVNIPYTPDLDVSLLYQMSFVAEADVFAKALERNFEIDYLQVEQEDAIYYSRTPEDRVISFDEEVSVLLQKVKAFNNKSQGCDFFCNGVTHKTYAARVIDNSYLRQCAEAYEEMQIVFVYEQSIVFRYQGKVLCFDRIEDISNIAVGDRLGGF